MGEPTGIGEAKRILVFGVTGSGKSTLAQKIARRTDLPYVSIDDLTWLPNWVPISKEEQTRRIAAVCAEEAWVIDHLYATWSEVALARVELVVALDYPRMTSLGRLVRRCARNIVTGTPLCNGNRETLRNCLSRTSIIVWHFKSFRRKRDRIRRWTEVPPAFKVIRFGSPREADRWLSTL